jgi:ABC-type Mn2+/Zn2+ transport system permease subunit
VKMNLDCSKYMRFLQFLLILIVVSGMVISQSALAAKIGEIKSIDLVEPIARFWRLEDHSVRNAVVASILMGICCGLLGSFLVVRKLSLVGDTLSHAVLPGVALAFMWSGNKDPLFIFLGAVGAGLIGTVLVQLIQSTTSLKSDSALGMVLSGFYALGISLFTIIQKYPQGNKSGLNSFLFGQAAAISETDIILMGIVTVLSLGIIKVFYKEFLVSSFDELYAQSLGLTVSYFHYTLIVLLSFAVVISLQATGVVLVSAMLITPAATAYLLTDRLHHLIGYSIVLGVAAGIIGCFTSFLGNNFPTGPFMVISASLIFIVVFLFAPRYGIIVKLWKSYYLEKKVHIENVLKIIYHILESNNFKNHTVTVAEVMAKTHATENRVYILFKSLVCQQWASWVYPFDKEKTQILSEKKLILTSIGWSRACEIVRNHRLWELYLTNEAHYSLDHVHEDAEKIEHILGESTVRELEKKLNYPKLDPHGKPIPSLRDIGRKSDFRENGPKIEGFKQNLH